MAGTRALMKQLLIGSFQPPKDPEAADNRWLREAFENPNTNHLFPWHRTRSPAHRQLDEKIIV
jgi:hypothetical protein